MKKQVKGVVFTLTSMANNNPCIEVEPKNLKDVDVLEAIHLQDGHGLFKDSNGQEFWGEYPKIADLTDSQIEAIFLNSSAVSDDKTITVFDSMIQFGKFGKCKN